MSAKTSGTTSAKTEAQTQAQQGAAAAEKTAKSSTAAVEQAANSGTAAVEQAAKSGTVAVEQAVKSNTEAFDKAFASSKEGFGKALDAGNQAFTQSFDQAMKFTKDQVGRYYPDAAKSFDELAEVQKDNAEAFFAAQTAATKGAETIGEQIYAFNRKAVDAGLETMKAMFGVKSFQDALELQTGFARERFEDLVAESAKLSELTIQTSKETVEPITARLSQTVETAFKPIGR